MTRKELTDAQRAEHLSAFLLLLLEAEKFANTVAGLSGYVPSLVAIREKVCMEIRMREAGRKLRSVPKKDGPGT